MQLSEIVVGRIWASERSVWFSGVQLRARTSVIRLDDGRLLVHSPTPPSDGWMKQVAELGTVSWLVHPTDRLTLLDGHRLTLALPNEARPTTPPAGEPC